MTVDLIIGGASKSGTTALYDMLRQNPSFFLPRRKELHYFSRPFLERTTAGPGDAAVLDEIPVTLSAYLDHYGDKQPGQIAVDVSPSYLFHYGSARQMVRDLPDAKVVFILRSPPDKVFSQYVHLMGEGRETLSFDDGLQQEKARKAKGFADMWLYAESGYYADAVSAFQSVFGAERVKIILFDDFRRDPDAVLREICLFAGLDGTQTFHTGFESNISGVPRSVLLARLMAPNRFTNALRRVMPARLGQGLRRILRGMNTGIKPELTPELRATLAALYDEDIARLETLIGRPTGWRSVSDHS